jgi:hypothetical protein
MSFTTQEAEIIGIIREYTEEWAFDLPSAFTK